MGPSSARDDAGTSATTAPPLRTVSVPPGVSSPITAVLIPQRPQTARTSSSFDGCTIASIRSCDSDVRISNGSIPGSRSGTAPRSSDVPIPARGDPDAVAVAADPRDHTGEEPPVPLLGERPEQERIEQGHGPRSHRHDVADDPTDARRRTLIRLDRAGVRVRLDLEHDGDPVA